MYQIRQSKPFREQLSVETEKGKRVFDITLNITPQLAKEYRALQVRMLDLQRRQRESGDDPALVEEIGSCVVDTMQLLLGGETAAGLIELYEGNYTSMFYDVFPFINEVIVPQVQSLARERKQQLKRRFR